MAVAASAFALTQALGNAGGTASPQQTQSSSPRESPTPSASPTPEADPLDLRDTRWAGTDSQGTPTEFTLHANGSTAVGFSGNNFDDPGDTWVLDGTVLTIIIRGVEGVGDATYVGEVVDANSPIDLTLVFSDVSETRTLTISRT